MSDKKTLNKEKHFWRPTWIEIDLEALKHNFYLIRNIVGKKVRILVTVKSNAYGHGIIPVSGELVNCGVDYLGVATIDEGILLRKNGFKVPILVLGNILVDHVEPIIKYNLCQAVSSIDLAYVLNKEAKKQNKIANIHIKIDTGMGRLGILHNDALEFIKKINNFSNLKIEGIFTHFPCADTDKKFTLAQINIFNKIIQDLDRIKIHIPLKHAANSTGLISYKNSHFNLVRPGLIIYGLSPVKDLKLKLKPVMGLYSRIIFIKDLPKGHGISYGHIYKTKRKTSIATLPIGYGDGYMRHFSNQARVLVNTRFCPVIGRVCMDQVMVDVTMVNVKIGDKVTLIGQENNKKISVEELADLADTIPYEITCSFNNRIPRIYIN